MSVEVYFPTGALLSLPCAQSLTGLDEDGLRRAVVEEKRARWVWSISRTGSWEIASWRFWVLEFTGWSWNREPLEGVLQYIAPKDPAWISSRELAVRFMVSPATIVHLVKRGQLRAKRAAGIPWVQVDAESVRELLRNRLLERRPKGKAES